MGEGLSHMKCRAILFAAAVALAAASATPLVGSTSQCVGSRRLTVTHNVSTSVKFVDLDGDLGNDLNSVTCDLDHTRMTLNFKSQLKRDGWWIKFQGYSNHFLVEGCTGTARSTLVTVG